MKKKMRGSFEGKGKYIMVGKGKSKSAYEVPLLTIHIIYNYKKEKKH